MKILTPTPRHVNMIHEYQRQKKILKVFNEKANNLSRKRNQTPGFKRKHHMKEEMNFKMFKNCELTILLQSNYYSEMKAK